METYSVTVRRIVREDIVLLIDAETEKEAKEKALSKSVNETEWECYDCEYFID